jgi:hypothetical protein
MTGDKCFFKQKNGRTTSVMRPFERLPGSLTEEKGTSPSGTCEDAFALRFEPVVESGARMKRQVSPQESA